MDFARLLLTELHQASGPGRGRLARILVQLQPGLGSSEELLPSQKKILKRKKEM